MFKMKKHRQKTPPYCEKNAREENFTAANTALVFLTKKKPKQPNKNKINCQTMTLHIKTLAFL